MPLVIAEILANGSVNGHSAPLICGTPLTVVEGEKLRLIIYLGHVINYFVKLFSLISTNLVCSPCTLANGLVLYLTPFYDLLDFERKR